MSVRKGSEKCASFLHFNWIRSGANKIKDLSFVDGKLDLHHMYRKIRTRTNIHSEFLMCRKELLPYQESLKTMINSNSNYIEFCKFVKLKPFYLRLRDQMAGESNSVSLPNFLSLFCRIDDMVKVFTRKIVLQKEIKLHEFNFKLVYGILPCNVNLRKWGIKISAQCDVCGRPQTIEHLLFSCCYVKPLWRVAQSVFDITITFESILGVDNIDCDNIITLVRFLIHTNSG